MGDFTQVIQQIKQSDLRTATLAKDIKEMEMETKSLESERIQLVSQESELIQNIAYKRQIIDKKACEKNLLKNQFERLSKMLDQTKGKIEIEETQLVNAQHELWDIRINFSNSVDEFLKNHEYLISNRKKIYETVQKRKAQKKMKEEVKQLEQNVSTLESQFRRQKCQLDIVDHLKMDKEMLEKEPDNGGEFKRLKSRIENCLKELNKYDVTQETNLNNSESHQEPPHLDYVQLPTFVMKVQSKIINKNKIK